MLPDLLIFTLLTSFAASTPAASPWFYPERGDYRYVMKDILHHMRTEGADYLIFNQDSEISNAHYKLDSKRNEFKIKDWYLHDWFKLQDMFALDLDKYTRAFNGQDFNEAKRNQFSQFKFNSKKYLHQKNIPTMKEWGGLTHPPLKKLKRPLEVYASEFKPLNYLKVESRFFDPKLQDEIDHASHSELTFGNRLTVLTDRAAFEMKKKMIARAKQSIFMSSLVFACDQSTKEIVNMLVNKRRLGLDVRIIADNFISKLFKLNECLDIMEDAGIQVIRSKDFFNYKRKAIYHTKTLVVDFNEAIAGGHNMIDADNTSRGQDFKNRDVDLHVEGPMVTDIIKQFVENWQHHFELESSPALTPMKDYQHRAYSQMTGQRAQGQRGSTWYGSILGTPELRMHGVCRFIKQAPYEDQHSIGKAYLKLLDKVQGHLVIEDPINEIYSLSRSKIPLLDKFDSFEMFNQLHQKVMQVAVQGVKVDYITTNIDMAGNENVPILNERIKNLLELGRPFRATFNLFKLNLTNKYFGKTHYANLLKHWVPKKNIHVWTNISFMHSKVFYFDRIVASIGSYNLNHNATDHAYESTSICMDEKLNRELDAVLVQDMVNSIPLVFSK